MCLTLIEKFEVPNEGIGYKVFRQKYDDGLMTPYKNHIIYFGDEVRANTPTIDADDGGRYISGFHIFTTRADAIDFMEEEYGDYCVYKIRYRNVLSTGMQFSYPCFTAEFMTVEREGFEAFAEDFIEDDEEEEEETSFFDDCDEDDWDWDDDEDDDFFDEEVEDDY
jgi:hypothetical protein